MGVISAASCIISRCAPELQSISEHTDIQTISGYTIWNSETVEIIINLQLAFIIKNMKKER